MSASKKAKKIGVIAEDASDVAVMNEIFLKYTDHSKFKIHRFLGQGCSKIRNKCDKWVENLSISGCELILVIHDLDDRVEMDLRKELVDKTRKYKTSVVVVIPVTEIEAWLLTEADALKRTLSLKRDPKLPSNPETVADPKKEIGVISKKYSGITYLHTIHNERIAKQTSIKSFRKCVSFKLLDDAVSKAFGK